MIGIYRITSPSGKIYIGQSINIESRIYRYKRLELCKTQIKLYRSFLKYGVLSHIFEVQEECNVHELNDKERKWQEHFDSVKYGLNCRLSSGMDKTGTVSEETRIRMICAQRTRVISSEGKERLRQAGKKSKGRKYPNKIGKKHSPESKRKIALSRVGRKHSEETKERIRRSLLLKNAKQ